MPYNSNNSRAQLMTLGFKKRRQLKCTQSYIKYSQSIIEAVTEAKKKK